MHVGCSIISTVISVMHAIVLDGGNCQRQASPSAAGSEVFDLIIDEEDASERVRQLLREQQLGLARSLLHDQLRVLPQAGARWAQLANLERRCAKRQRSGAPSSLGACMHTLLLLIV